MITHQLTLDYTIATGWFRPFVEGLQTGQANARRCDTCRRVSFPPVRVCECGSAEGTWEVLSGDAVILHRTDGSDGSFALVQFNGADTHSVVRVVGIPSESSAGILVVAAVGLPQLCLGPPAGMDAT